MTESHLLLITLLKGMCENNDHETTLAVLQTLGKVKRAGYLSVEDIVFSLSYCADIFAGHENIEFFKEFSSCMSDITEASAENPFSLRSRCLYYLTKNGSDLVKRAKKYCPNIDTEAIEEHMYSMIRRNNICRNSQLELFYKTIFKDGEEMTKDDFMVLCKSF